MCKATDDCSRARDLALINAASFLRSFGVGLIGVVLGIYLFRTGLASFPIGLNQGGLTRLPSTVN